MGSGYCHCNGRGVDHIGLCRAPNQSDSNATVWNLNISGSSALRNGLQTFISANFCKADTFITYAATNTAGTGANNPDFRAYSCVSNGAAGNPVPNGTVLTIYYRSEWDSVAGVAPIVFPATTIGRLNLDPAACVYAADPRAANTQNANPHVTPSIDNFSKIAAPVLPVSIDDAAKNVPTNLGTATGQYGWYFEGRCQQVDQHCGRQQSGPDCQRDHRHDAGRKHDGPLCAAAGYPRSHLGQ
jgi:hypothetical protein